MRIQTFGVDPPDELIADEAIHTLKSSSSEGIYYILSLKNPAIGLFGCFKREDSHIWYSKTNGLNNLKESTVLNAKLKRIRITRRQAKLTKYY